MTVCIWRWPNINAPSISDSESSWASDSTISTALAVPGTMRSMLGFGILSISGFRHIALDEADARPPPIPDP